jgi:hypothetical protein
MVSNHARPFYKFERFFMLDDLLVTGSSPGRSFCGVMTRMYSPPLAMVCAFASLGSGKSAYHQGDRSSIFVKPKGDNHVRK